jgi:type 1 glutamine amidotransferase
MNSSLKVRQHLLVVVGLILVLACSQRAQAAEIRVLLLTGLGKRDWRTQSRFLHTLLSEAERFDVRICESPVGLTTESLAGFDVLVADYLGPDLGGTTEKAIESFLRAGKGLVVLHDALRSLADQPAAALGEIVPISWTDRGASPVCAPFQIFDLQLTQPQHPALQGLQDGLRTGDQPVQNLTLKTGAELLATNAGGQPLIFVSTFGKGRVFGTALGHGQAAMQERAFTFTFLHGVEWAASGMVVDPAPSGVVQGKPDAPRVLVITGGHDHEASFYDLFDDTKTFGWVPVSDSKSAFQSDLRNKYDVLVMYDFTRELDDKQKAILKAFVESDKGVVVLHHGILNFQNWPWWHEEVVGGKYRLQNEGDIPNSTVKMGQEHLITPVAGHPITAGIEPFRVVDETYRGLFIVPGITPLLTTENRTSDRTVGWIGPCKTSRVVFIQLGHDHSPFRHPSYRALVRNSILWTTHKLN